MLDGGGAEERVHEGVEGGAVLGDGEAEGGAGEEGQGELHVQRLPRVRREAEEEGAALHLQSPRRYQVVQRGKV